MKEILEIIFPIKLHANILQLQEYNFNWFLSWLFKNFFKRKVEIKKPLVITIKVKQIFLISSFLAFISFIFISPLLTLFLLTQPYILFGVSLLILKPYEIYNKKKTIEKTREKILALKKKGLKIIAITGSYGKTSTKEILYQILKKDFEVLRTPESYNTIFGIARVVDLELDNSYQYFICEMSIHSYKKGDIKELCYMVPPDYGIITGITGQHLERIGSLKTIQETKFELFEAIPNKENVVLNLDDENIKLVLQEKNIQISPVLKTNNIEFTQEGTKVTLNYRSKNYQIKNSFFGFANIKNIILSSEMAIKLGLNIKKIFSFLKNLTPIPNRMTINKLGSSIVVNNTYSSNQKSFEEMLKTAKLVKGQKSLVTPGIVELGVDEEKVHLLLGKLAQGIFKKIVLVGKNKRTNSLAAGLGSSENIEFLEDSKEKYQNKIYELSRIYNWIFLENDLPQNY